MQITKTIAGLAAVALMASAQSAYAQSCGGGAITVIPGWNGTPGVGEITSDTTWSGTVILQGGTFVKNNATLRILPGTVVRGQPRQAAIAAGSTAGAAGFHVVTRDGRIDADADPNNPIVFTTAAIDNNDDGNPDNVDGNTAYLDPWTSGADIFLDDAPCSSPIAPLRKNGLSNVQLWGGLALLGNAPTNLGNQFANGTTILYGENTIEGLPIPGYLTQDSVYGGFQPHDSSGVLEYVSIRYAGEAFSTNNELNGLTLGGVGDGTKISYVEVFANFDDGIEWFGGTVNGDHLAVFFAGDDMFDMDQGYTGTNQFLFGVMPFFNENDTTAYADRSGDSIAELDGDDSDAGASNHTNKRVNQAFSVTSVTPWPTPGINIYNLTAIGTTLVPSPNFTPVSPAADNFGMVMRHGFMGSLHNSIIVNTGSQEAIDISTNAIVNYAAGTSVQDNVNSPLRLVNVVCTTTADGAALGTDEQTAVSNGEILSEFLRFGNASTGDNNRINLASFALAREDTSFDPTGDANGKLNASLVPAKIDPRPAVFQGGCPAPRGIGLDPAATYRGAFPLGVPLWTDTWTAMSQGGLL